jgi:hypothetical protein
MALMIPASWFSTADLVLASHALDTGVTEVTGAGLEVALLARLAAEPTCA